MKKIIFPGLFLILSVASFSAEMKFLTVLSQPVGTLAKVELLENADADIFHLNFCNENALIGTINVGDTLVEGALDILNLQVDKASAWYANAKEYRLGTSSGDLSVAKDGNLEVKKLTVSGQLKIHNPGYETNPKAYLKVDGSLINNVSEQNLTAKTASFTTMKIPSYAWMKSPASVETLRADGETTGFRWRDVNPSACGTTEACKANLLVYVDNEGTTCPNGKRADGTCKVKRAATYGWVEVTPHTANVKSLCNVTTGHTLVSYNCNASVTSAVVRHQQSGNTWTCDWDLNTYSGRCGSVTCDETKNGSYCIQSQTPSDKGNGVCSYPLYQCGVTKEEYWD